jgi:hypothetical protein
VLLLSREAFKTQVLARSQGRCVFCTAPAVDAHHILERKLFADGGYYLANGAAVCAAHHWDCETTVLSVEAVRVAACIAEPVVPPGFDPGTVYDKWGNRQRADGTWAPGPLMNDTGARRALAAGGKLGFIFAMEGA